MTPSRLIAAWFVAALLSLVFATTAAADVFRNSYLTFDMPNGWACRNVETEWVCRPVDSELARRAIIVFTAKVAGPNDHMGFYEDYLSSLKSPRPREESSSISSSSTIIVPPHKVRIGSKEWMSARHQDALLPKFVSEYLVTLDSDTAILLTFSAHEEDFDVFYPAFAGLIHSLTTREPRASPDRGR